MAYLHKIEFLTSAISQNPKISTIFYLMIKIFVFQNTPFFSKKKVRKINAYLLPTGSHSCWPVWCAMKASWSWTFWIRWDECTHRQSIFPFVPCIWLWRLSSGNVVSTIPFVYLIFFLVSLLGLLPLLHFIILRSVKNTYLMNFQIKKSFFVTFRQK